MNKKITRTVNGVPEIANVSAAKAAKLIAKGWKPFTEKVEDPAKRGRKSKKD